MESLQIVFLKYLILKNKNLHCKKFNKSLKIEILDINQLRTGFLIKNLFNQDYLLKNIRYVYQNVEIKI